MPIFVQSYLGMQFKHPEILWALFLLAIPILIHLFQLRRFQKTPFTNVAMLQKVVSESRKSNTLKKWLLLITRLFLLAALITAFAQPFSSKATALKEKETVIYLDNSFSMQAKTNGISLLEKTVQDLIKNLNESTVFSLFTNENSFENVSVKDIQNQLLSLPYSFKQLNFEQIGLKANSLFSKSQETIKNLIVLSDFQENMASESVLNDSTINTYLVPIRPRENLNVSIDSVYLEDANADPATLTVFLSGGVTDESLPISLYNGAELIAKNAADFGADQKASVDFSIPGNKEINGRLGIVDNGLGYDNTFYFNINAKDKIKVLAIGSSTGDYLDRLFGNDEFDFQKYPLSQLDYSILENQNVIVLDNLEDIPNSLQRILGTFKENGGTLIIVPSLMGNLLSYNELLSRFSRTQFMEKVQADANITTISFEHPIYKNVFERRVTNFQYPTVKQFFKLQTSLPSILSMEGGDAFLSGIDGFYVFSTSLESSNTNFINSPLIVPTFYNMAQSSLKAPELYHMLGQPTTVDVAARLTSDNILKVVQNGNEFIPMQQSFPNQVKLTFDQIPTEDGIFTIEQNGQSLKNISFDYPRSESLLKYLDTETLENSIGKESVNSLFEELEAASNITAYWKWFVILALLLALTEVIIQKFVS